MLPILPTLAPIRGLCQFNQKGGRLVQMLHSTKIVLLYSTHHIDPELLTNEVP
jgi:hypothetical protein